MGKDRSKKTVIKDPCAIIQLESSFNFNGKSLQWLLAIPRHHGFGIYRLCLNFISTDIFSIEGPNPPEEVYHEEMIGIWDIKVETKADRRRHPQDYPRRTK